MPFGAKQVRPHLKVIEHAQLVAADLVEDAALNVDQSDDIGHQRRIIFQVDGVLQIGYVAADAGKILPEVDEQAVGRVLVVVEGVVIKRITNR